jgi:FkbM family methyltransferase
MHRLLNANKAILADGRFGSTDGGPSSLKEFVRKFPTRFYNAVFTPMGRKNFFYFIKRQRVKLNPDYRQHGTMAYLLKNGNSFVLHRGNQLSELVFLEGAYEPLESQIVSKVVQRNDVVLDCGANVGYFSALLDRLVKPGGQVHSFEPGAGTFTKLEQTKELLHLDRSSLHPLAVGSAVGEIDFWSSTTGSDAQQMTVKCAALGRHLRHEKVAATTLDAFAAELKKQGVDRIAFVKCDIEGAETAMLKGAAGLLRSEHPPIWLIEHNRTALIDQGAASSDLLAHFAGCDIYFVPLCWPPSEMAAPQAAKWNGQPDALPDECNLIVFPTRGVHAQRAAALKQSGLLAC